MVPRLITNLGFQKTSAQSIDHLLDLVKICGERLTVNSSPHNMGIFVKTSALRFHIVGKTPNFRDSAKHLEDTRSRGIGILRKGSKIWDFRIVDQIHSNWETPIGMKLGPLIFTFESRRGNRKIGDAPQNKNSRQTSPIDATNLPDCAQFAPLGFQRLEPRTLSRFRLKFGHLPISPSSHEWLSNKAHHAKLRSRDSSQGSEATCDGPQSPSTRSVFTARAELQQAREREIRSDRTRRWRKALNRSRKS